MNLKVLSAAMILMASTPLNAADDDCADPKTQMGASICAGLALNAAEVELAAAYKQLLARLTPASKERLQASQRAWLGFREAECVYRSNGVDGGFMRPTIVAKCAAELTEDRITRLTAVPACADANAACVR